MVTWLPEQRRAYASPHEEAVAAAAALDAVDAASRGLPPPEAALPSTQPGFSAGRPHFAVLRSNERVTAAGHAQDVRLLDLDLGGSGLQYQPGDVIAVWPQQREGSVGAFMQRCGLDPDAWVRVEAAHAAGGGADGGARVAAVVRVGALVAGALDVDSASPRRALFEALRHFAAAGGRERERLAYFASPQGRDDLHEYNRREGAPHGLDGRVGFELI